MLGFFNWTWTYRQDSDIFLPKFYFTRRSKVKEVRQNHTWIHFNKEHINVTNIKRLYYKNEVRAFNHFSTSFVKIITGFFFMLLTIDFQRRSRRPAILWMVSHCNTCSEREQYVDELNRYYRVVVR